MCESVNLTRLLANKLLLWMSYVISIIPSMDWLPYEQSFPAITHSLTVQNRNTWFSGNHSLSWTPGRDRNARLNDRSDNGSCDTWYPGPHSTPEGFGLSLTVAWKPFRKGKFADRAVVLFAYCTWPPPSNWAATKYCRNKGWAYMFGERL